MKLRSPTRSEGSESARKSAPLLTVDVETTGDGATVIVKGEIDASSAAEFRTAIADALDAQPLVSIDMADCRFLDSSGVTAIIAGYKKAEAIGGAVRIVRPSQKVLRVLQLVGQTERFVEPEPA